MWRIRLGDIMEKITKIKLSLNNEAEVVVVADIKMHGKEDTDDVYFVMFNILHNPLRFCWNFIEARTLPNTSFRLAK